MAQYVVLIYESESDTQSPLEVYGEVMDAHNRFAEEVIARGGQDRQGQRLAGHGHRDLHPRRRGHRRPVRRDQGGALAALLPDRG